MKSHFSFLLFVLLAGVLLLPCQQAKAQVTLHDTVSYAVGDTMFVAWAHTNFGARTNALRSTIMGDTLADGTRANLHRVYKLKTNGYYWEADDITNVGFPLILVADPTDKIGAGNFPPILQMKDLRDDGTNGANHLITAASDVTLKNIFITGRQTGGAQTSYQPILFAGNNSNYTIDGCIFEQSNFSLVVFTGTKNNCVVINNKFRNLQEAPVTQQYTGRGISIWADQASVIIENNTFFNLGFVTFQMEGGSAKYLRYNHNTIIGTGRGIMSGSGDWWQSAYFANNLIINAWWQGERFADTHGSGRDPREAHAGLFNIGPLPSTYGPPQGRRLVIAKNYAFLDPAYIAKYGATIATDTIVRAWFMDPVSKLDYLTPWKVGGPNDGHMYIADTNWMSALPTGFTNYLNDANWLHPRYTFTGATFVDSSFKLITQIYAGITGGTQLFYHPTVLATDETWPLPESGAYTDIGLKTAGTDGLPIGDLNWFPTQKAAFLANQATYVSQIELLAGQVVVFKIDSLVEAEKGTVTGTAAVKPVSGFPYYDGPGNILFTFNSSAAGKIDSMVINTNRNNNGDRGQNFLLDGANMQNTSSYGELHFYSWEPGNNAWYTKPITVDSLPVSITGNAAAIALFTSLPAGSHTLEIKSSWGGQAFGEVDLYVHGIPKIALTIPSAVCKNGSAHVIGSPWAPSNFNSVSLGTAGTITWNLNAPVAGDYVVQVFYQLGGTTAQAVQLAEGTTTLASPSLAAKADSSEVDVVSGKFSLTQGNHSIKLSGATANIDYVQLIERKVILGVAPNNTSPYSYSLGQNYPNPFNPTTTINYSLGKASNVTLTVYNILGQRVATLVDGFKNAGLQSVVFDANKLASGVYFYRLEAGSFVKAEKMMLLK